MAIFTWPSSLPQNPERGFSETGGASVLRSQTDTGPAKMRRRAASPATLSVSYLMTTAQVTTFESFVGSSLQYVLRFNYTHPRTGNAVEVRIVPQGGNSYNIDYVAPGYWRVKMTLEILP